MSIQKRFTDDGELIYRPTRYPFEMLEAPGYLVQMDAFRDVGQVVGSNEITSSFLKNKNGECTQMPSQAFLFPSVEQAMKAAKNCEEAFREYEDGNCYPRVLKVRLSCIVEGVAFESIVRDITGGEKLEYVA